MRRREFIKLLGGVMASSIIAFAWAAWAKSWAQAAPYPGKGPKEMLIYIPREGTPAGMLTRICLAGTEGAAPLVIINHGSPPVAGDRALRKPASCAEVARFFTSRGYIVAFPLRRGYGETGGPWVETYGKCDSADFVTAGQATADDIVAALDFLLHEPYTAKSGTVIVGQSAGGWGTLALASRNPQGIAHFINFAGGRAAKRKSDAVYDHCSVNALVAAAGIFGRTTRQPTLWIYTENDNLVPKELSARLHAAYTAAGGHARYELLPPFGKEGHNLFFGNGGSKIWGPIVDRWLAATEH